MKIAVHQMCSGIAPESNVMAMISAIAESAEAGAVMYFSPEMAVMLDRDRSRGAASVEWEKDSSVLPMLCKAAASAGIWVHVGSTAVLAEYNKGKFANRSLIINDKGEICARYDKMHLFDVDLATGERWRESAAYASGPGPVIAETPLGPIGLTICYDMRFPDLYSVLSKAGVNVLAIPASFTVPTGKAHWHTLLRARAIESQVFVVAAAQSGHHQDGRETYGHSLVIDPWGDILLDLGVGEKLGFAEIDLNRLAEVRAQVPAQSNRRDIPNKVTFY